MFSGSRAGLAHWKPVSHRHGAHREMCCLTPEPRNETPEQISEIGVHAQRAHNGDIHSPQLQYAPAAMR